MAKTTSTNCYRLLPLLNGLNAIHCRYGLIKGEDKFSKSKHLISKFFISLLCDFHLKISIRLRACAFELAFYACYWFSLLMFAPGTHLLLVSFLLVLATFYLVYRSHRFEGSSLLQIDRHQTRYTSKYTSKRIAMWAGCALCESYASWNDKRLGPLLLSVIARR